MQKILNAILLFPVLAFCQKPPTINLVTDNAIINKWTHAVVNIESRTGKIGGSGTAIFLSYNNKNYLLTARHVIHDPMSADTTNKIADMLILVENYSERDIRDTFYADRHAYTFVGDAHFLIFGIPVLRPPYLFSSEKEDLALIDLSHEIMGQSFANTLYKRGYRPISINDIDTLCKIEYGQNIIGVGFPQESEVDTNKIGPLLKFRSRSVSLPVVSEGITNGKYDDIYFNAFLSIYHGFSGGPIIRNNKLIGIVHGSNNLPVYTTNATQLPYYRWFGLQLIKSSLIMQLIRKMESTGGI